MNSKKEQDNNLSFGLFPSGSVEFFDEIDLCIPEGNSQSAISEGKRDQYREKNAESEGMKPKTQVNKPKTRNYEEWLIESLKDHDAAVAYLNAALEESLKGDVESQALLLLALRDVAEAQGGIAKIAKKAHLGRESLYKTLSPKGNPSLSTLTALAHAMGLELRFC